MFDCNKTILGDFNQTINPENIKSIQNDYKNIVNEDSLLLTLNKSYRSTEEIANFYNFIEIFYHVFFCKFRQKFLRFLRFCRAIFTFFVLF